MLQLAKNLNPSQLQVVKSVKHTYPIKQRAFAVIYLPMTNLLKSLSVDEVFKYSKNKIKSTTQDSNQLISIAIDKWDYQNTKLLNTLYKLFSWKDACLIPVGPSTCEILRAVNSEPSLRNFLKSLFNIGVTAVEGGNDLDCLEIAAEENFIIRPSFAVNLEKDLTEQTIKKLEKIEMLSRACLKVETLTIFPHKRFAEFESQTFKSRSIMKYLQILKNSRRCARSIPYLRAPISAFGNVLPEELAIKEVNDFGHFAINAESAVALGLEQINEKHRSLFRT